MTPIPTEFKKLKVSTFVHKNYFCILLFNFLNCVLAMYVCIYINIYRSDFFFTINDEIYYKLPLKARKQKSDTKMKHLVKHDFIVILNVEKLKCLVNLNKTNM